MELPFAWFVGLLVCGLAVLLAHLFGLCCFCVGLSKFWFVGVAVYLNYWCAGLLALPLCLVWVCQFSFAPWCVDLSAGWLAGVDLLVVVGLSFVWFVGFFTCCIVRLMVWR